MKSSPLPADQVIIQLIFKICEIRAKICAKRKALKIRALKTILKSEKSVIKL